jgi:hypothetical protein
MGRDASQTAFGAMPGDARESRNTSRVLKKSASSVLASLRGSTYGKEYDSASSLAAALLNGLFEHPVAYLVLSVIAIYRVRSGHAKSFTSAY